MQGTRTHKRLVLVGGVLSIVAWLSSSALGAAPAGGPSPRVWRAPAADSARFATARRLEAVRSPVSNVARPRVSSGPAWLESRLDAMWRQSPTFRRQLLRLGGVGQLRITFSVQCQTKGNRAHTRVERLADTSLSADVCLGNNMREFDELIAHELEHILEQVDGVNLADRARHHCHHVNDGGGGFETGRAKDVGLMVAREMTAREGR
jgi:hypothetical protein